MNESRHVEQAKFITFVQQACWMSLSNLDNSTLNSRFVTGFNSRMLHLLEFIASA